MKKILIVTSSFQFVRTFLIPHIEYWVRNGWIVDVASDYDGIPIPQVNRLIDIPVKRTPLHTSNIIAIKRLAQHLESESYDIINCHTPIGAMIARCASHKARCRGTKLVYMAHGFHFYKGAPLLNWLVYYTAEKCMARYTDALITINNEDRKNAQNLLSEIPHQYYLHGVGYDTKHIRACNEDEAQRLRKQYDIHEDDFVLLYIARYVRHKNHSFLIKAFAELKQSIPNAKLLLLGQGECMHACRCLALKLGVDESVIFAGYKDNVSDYLRLAHVGVSVSMMEGLPIGVLEEMLVGLPVVVSDIRGHRDLIDDGQNGLLYTSDDKADLLKKLMYLYEHPEERKHMGAMAQKNMLKFSADNIAPQLVEIFEEVLS